jgi:hypothetical protein
LLLSTFKVHQSLKAELDSLSLESHGSPSFLSDICVLFGSRVPRRVLPALNILAFVSLEQSVYLPLILGQAFFKKKIELLFQQAHSFSGVGV